MNDFEAKVVAALERIAGALERWMPEPQPISPYDAAKLSFPPQPAPSPPPPDLLDQPFPDPNKP